MTLGKVGVEPDFDSAFPVHTDEIFRDAEVPNSLVELLEAIERAEQHV
jgi:hypothetical protein